MAVFHSLVNYIDPKKGILYRKMKKITKYRVIRNPLRSLLMKIDGFAVRPKHASDVEKAAVSSDLFYYFQPIGTQLILSDINVCTIR